MHPTLLVLLLSCSFCLLFAVYSISSYIAPGALNEIGLKGVGFTSACVLYISFSICTLFVGYVTKKIGFKLSILLGSIPYVIYICSLLNPKEITIYIASAILGIGASLLWNGQGTYLTHLSSSSSMSKHSIIFFTIYNTNYIIGNLLFFFLIGNIQTFDRTILYDWFILLAAIGSLASASFVLPFFRTFRKSEDEESLIENAMPLSLKEFFHRMKQILYSPIVLLLLIPSFHTGLTSSFYGGVYGTMVAQSEFLLEGQKKYISFCGLATGFGSLFGGILFLIIGSKYKNQNGSLSILLASLLQIICLMLISIIFPDDATLTVVFQPKFSIPFYKTIVLLIGFTLGFADFIYNTQLYKLFGSHFQGYTEEVFALYKCVQSIAMAISFGYSPYLKVTPHLLFQGILTVVSCFAFLRAINSILKYRSS